MKLFPILKPVADYFERQARLPLPSAILEKLGELRNQEARQKRAMYPPRRIVKRRFDPGRWSAK
jgi:hypothetical protein